MPSRSKTPIAAWKHEQRGRFAALLKPSLAYSRSAPAKLSVAFAKYASIGDGSLMRRLYVPSRSTRAPRRFECRWYGAEGGVRTTSKPGASLPLRIHRFPRSQVHRVERALLGLVTIDI